MDITIELPLVCIKRIERVAAEQKISFDDAVLFLLRKVEAPN